ncbi:hypothetical protein J3R30DRAFT_3701739 [Lentinula aciculospora]|uniref:Uncharacterized protein n=1 Tax=Lentinula aciculospora TaxID=153920 RepID=A0A9W9ADI0_9AGAR|nr:hypothetical protein J3R30DRAFT_3701739 [Lentinula aciculospora]
MIPKQLASASNSKISDPGSGLGGWGDPDKDYKVQDGAFAGFADPMHLLTATAFAGGSVQAFDNTAYFAEYPTRAPPMLNTSSDIYTDNMFPGATIRDVSNHTAGYLCYVYE